MSDVSSELPFVRKATGIVRGLGMADALVISLGIVNLQSGCMWLFAWTDLTFPGASPFWILTFSLIPCLFLGLVYTLFAIAMPRSGGDYVYSSRALSPSLGFAQSWVVGIFAIVGIGTDLVYIVQSAFSPFFGVYGILTGNATLVDWANLLLTPNATFIGGVLFIVACAVLALLSVRIVAKINLFFMIISILGMVAAFIVLAGTSHEAFIASFNSKVGSFQTYEGVIQTAKGAGWTLNPISIAASATAMGFGFWIYWGYFFPAYLGGEISSVSKSMSVGIIGGLIFSWVVESALVEWAISVFGREFVWAANFVAGTHAGWLVPSYPWLFLVASMATDNQILIFLMNFSVIAAFVVCEVAKILCATRVVFAWSFDRIFPMKFADVSKKSHAPTWATIFTLVLAIIFTAVAAYTSMLAYYLNTSGAILIALLILSVSAIVFAYRRKDLIERAPKIVSMKIGGVYVLSILGVGTLISCAYAAYYALTTTILGPISLQAYAMIVGMFVAGFAIFYVSRAYHLKRDSIDINSIFRELAPE